MTKLMIVLLCVFIMGCSGIVLEEPEKEPLFLAAVSSEVFHTLRCSYVRAIVDRNVVLFNSYNDAIASGRRPCFRCKPRRWHFFAKKDN